MGEYDDIIDIDWKGNPQRARMSLENRAKIFLPFAALRGFEEAIETKNKVIVEKVELTEEKQEHLDEMLNILINNLLNGEKSIVSAVYFYKDKRSGLGSYLKRTGILTRINVESGYIKIANDKIMILDLCELELEDNY